MEIISVEYNVIDRSSFPKGPWDKEPDIVRLWDERTWAPGLILRPSTGHLCGYIGFTENHPLYDIGYNEAYKIAEGEGEVRNQVFGSELTFAGKYDHISPCIWWLGWDHAHAGDVVPSLLQFSSGRSNTWLHRDETYKDIMYVKREIEDIVSRLYPVYKRPEWRTLKSILK